jgi:histidine triad (HIT) family protein
MTSCVFCSIAKKQKDDYIVWENRKYLLILNNQPARPGHCMLVPKKHIEGFFCLNVLLYIELLLLVRKLARILKRATGARRIGLVVAGLSIPHLHIQLVPINKKNELFSLLKRSEKTHKQLSAECQRLRCFFAKK